MTTRTPLPLRVEEKITEAGASVYAWYVNEIAEQADPSGSRRMWSRRIETGGPALLGAVGFTALAVLAGAWLPLLGALGCLVLAGVRVAGAKMPDWPVLALFAVPLVPAPGSGALACAGTAVAVAVVVWMTTVRVRALATSVFIVAASVTGGVAARLTRPSETVMLLAVCVGAAAALAAAHRLQGGHSMSPFPIRKVPAKVYTSTLADPPVHAPVLLRSAVTAFQDRARHERRSGVRSSEDSRIDIKRIGGAAERQTALLLLGARHGSLHAVHDVVLPDSTQGANADHVALTRAGFWVLDSKRFGTAADPGVVEHVGGGRIVHRSQRGQNDLASTLETLAWAVRGIRARMQTPARGLMVIHNAHVAPGLSILVPGRDGEVLVDVVSARTLTAFIESAPPILSDDQVSSAGGMFRKRLVSSTTGRAPALVTSVGGAPTTPAPVAARRTPNWTSDSPPADPAAAPATTTPDRPSPAPSTDPGPLGMPGSRIEEERKAARDTLSYVGETPGERVERKVAERWAQMDEAEPAAPDDVDADLRGITRGTPLVHTTFSDDLSSIVTHDVVALSTPRQGADGPLVWACDPTQWVIHQSTGQPVMSTPLHVEDLSIRGES